MMQQGRKHAARPRGVGVRKAAAAALATSAALLCAAAPARAGTWTINGTITNDTGSSAGSCPPESPAGDVGCVNVPLYDGPIDGTFQNGRDIGIFPPPYVSAGSAPQPFQFFAPYFDEGADLYMDADAPDGSSYVLTVQDDIGESDSSGAYAGCAEATAQSPQFVCTPSWTGSQDDDDVAVDYAFYPATQAPSLSAGQWCSATLGGGGPSSADCTSAPDGGRLSPLAMLPFTAIAFQTLTPSVPVTVTAAGWPGCTIGGSNGSTCTLSNLYPLGAGNDVTIALAGSQPSPVTVRVEATAVGNGDFTDIPPSQLPGGSVVSGTLTAGRTLSAGQAVRVGPYQLAMESDGDVAEYAAQGSGRYRVFASGTSVPGSKLVAQPDGSVAVRSPKGGTLWSSADPAPSYPRKGNLVLYSRAHRRLWASSGPLSGPVTQRVRSGAVTLAPGDGIPAGGHLDAGPSRLAMQADGDLVLSRRGKVRWRSKTHRQPGAYLQVGRDGDAVVWSLDHRALWSTRTAGHRGARLRLRANGAVDVTGVGGRELWRAHR